MPDQVQLVTVALPSTLTVATVETVTLPENTEVSSVTVGPLATAPVGSAAVFDVLDAGTSVFAGALGTIRAGETAQGNDTGPDMTTSSTTIVIDPAAPGIAPENGQVLTIGSEDVQVTSEGGSYQTTGGGPEFQVTVTRAVNGTTAATHAAGTSIFPAKPKVPAGATSQLAGSKYVPTKKSLESVPIPSGDALAVSVTQIGSTTAGGGGDLVLELLQR